MSREVVEWLRDHARRCEQTGIAHSHGNGGRSSEVEYALKFADMIEQRFAADMIAKLANKPTSFPPTKIYAATGTRRRRGPKFR
jgi:hypothetical protein